MQYIKNKVLSVVVLSSFRGEIRKKLKYNNKNKNKIQQQQK